MRNILFTIGLILTSSLLKAQMIPSRPLSEKESIIEEQYDFYTIENYNNNELFLSMNGNPIDSFSESAMNSAPMYFAIGKKTSIDLKESHNWQNINEYKILRILVHSDSSLGFKFRFDKFHLSPNSSVFIYPPNKSNIYGAFTFLNNRSSNTFITQEIPYRTLFIEINIPNEEFELNQLSIDEIIYVYQSESFVKLNSESFGKTDTNCMVNVNCDPYYTDWCNEARATVKLEIAKRFNPNNHDFNTTYSHYLRCSGVILNSKNQDLTPFLLTAHHCVDDNDGAGGIYDYTPFLDNSVVTFNWQSSNCWSNTLGNDKMTLVGLQKIAGRAVTLPKNSTD